MDALSPLRSCQIADAGVQLMFKIFNKALFQLRSLFCPILAAQEPACGRGNAVRCHVGQFSSGVVHLMPVLPACLPQDLIGGGLIPVLFPETVLPGPVLRVADNLPAQLFGLRPAGVQIILQSGGILSGLLGPLQIAGYPVPTAFEHFDYHFPAGKIQNCGKNGKVQQSVKYVPSAHMWDIPPLLLICFSAYSPAA